eukprot:TRINITY_DN5768_c0_g2_i1.p1 TRINITY_DN5768_c0_g2~~TRINITY_DN5768_c0_g2_i1.p1  ORF type:complete len:245 (+),score=66.33 TRINITY_DN5768_c0_g2_i1:37-735(+)
MEDIGQAGTTSGLDDELATILSALERIRHQQRKMSHYQEISNKWQMQHHKNLMSIAEGLNRLGQIVRDTTGVPVVPVELHHDPSMMDAISIPKSPLDHEASGGNFHDLIMRAHSLGDNRELEHLIVSVTHQQFTQLQRESFSVIMKMLPSIIQDKQNRPVGLVMLWEGTQRFSEVFRYEEHSSVVDRLFQAARSFAEEVRCQRDPNYAFSTFGVTDEELEFLHRFLERARRT